MRAMERLMAGVLALGLVLGVGVMRCSPAWAEDAEGTKNLADTLANECKTFSELMTLAGIADTLKGAQLTVFAPTDKAFSSLPKGKLDALKKDPAALKALLLNHIVTGSIPPKQLAVATKLKTLGALELTVKETGDRDRSVPTINDIKIAQRLRTTNGRIYSLEKVILTP